MSKVLHVQVDQVKSSASVWVRRDGKLGVAVVLRDDRALRDNRAIAAVFYPGEPARCISAGNLTELFHPVETGTEVVITVEG